MDTSYCRFGALTSSSSGVQFHQTLKRNLQWKCNQLLRTFWLAMQIHWKKALRRFNQPHAQDCQWNWQNHTQYPSLRSRRLICKSQFLCSRRESISLLSLKVWPNLIHHLSTFFHKSISINVSFPFHFIPWHMRLMSLLRL